MVCCLSLPLPFPPFLSSFRKRLREVCSEELPWRSQANLLLATCCLDRLLGKPSHGGSGGGSEGGSGEGSGGGRGGENEAKPSVQPNRLRFDTAGVIINGVIPVHPDALPGQKVGDISKHLKSPPGVNSSLLLLLFSAPSTTRVVGRMLW